VNASSRFVAQPTQPLLADQDWILHEGTPVRMRIMRTVSSVDAHDGDKADFQTLDDISVGDVVVIPKNSTAIATVTVADPRNVWREAANSA